MILIRWASMKDPVVHVEDLKAWLKAHQYPRSYNATAHNGVIDDLLQEIEDAEKEG